jgi:dienelactone hydrolase
MNPKMILSSPSKLVDRDFNLKIKGLKPNQEMKLQAKMQDDMKRTWSSYGIFTADDRGEMDLTKTAPDKGTYSKCSPQGLIWSMQLEENNTSLPPIFLKQGSQSHRIVFQLLLEKEIVDEKELQINFCSSDIEKTNINNPVIGKFFKPETKDKLPAVIVVGGSTGGFFWAEQMAALLSTKGYAALALNYFDPNNNNLPNELIEIELEYFKEGLNWLKNQPQIDKNEISMMGISRGGELSLLFGSYFSKTLTSIVSYVPASHVFEGIAMGGHKGKSAWTYQNKSIDIIKYPEDTIFSRDKNPANLREIHDRALNEATSEQFKKARIQIENINCPILMISGGKEATWSSAKMCETMMETLKNNNNPHQSKHLNFENMGHTFFLPNIPPIIANPSVKPKHAAQANKKSWTAALKFLNKHF